MKDKPLKERIREVLDELVAKAVKACRELKTADEAIKVCKDNEDHALQAILTEIKENLPKKKEVLGGWERWQSEKVGWNAYHDEMEKLLEAQTKKLE
jgi:2-C-methyl-D-erythritol 4-phosphate cytidylyltransferase